MRMHGAIIYGMFVGGSAVDAKTDHYAAKFARS
jgi:hypothetical protein